MYITLLFVKITFYEDMLDITNIIVFKKKKNHINTLY